MFNYISERTVRTLICNYFIYQIHYVYLFLFITCKIILLFILTTNLQDPLVSIHRLVPVDHWAV